MINLSFIERVSCYLLHVIYAARRGDSLPHHDMCRFEANSIVRLMGRQIANLCAFQMKLVFATDRMDLTYFCDAVMASCGASSISLAPHVFIRRVA